VGGRSAPGAGADPHAVAGRMALFGCLAMLPASARGRARRDGGVRSARSPARSAGTLYPGVPLSRARCAARRALQLRDQIFSTDCRGAGEEGRSSAKAGPVLKFRKEGLPVGIGVSVRYQLDPRHPAGIANNLPQPGETSHAVGRRPRLPPDVFRLTWCASVSHQAREGVVGSRQPSPAPAADGIVVKTCDA